MTFGGCFSPKSAFLGAFRRSHKKSILFTFLDRTKIDQECQIRLVNFHLLHKPIKGFLLKNAKRAQKSAPWGPPVPPRPPETHFSVGGGMCSDLTQPKTAITMVYGLTIRCFVPTHRMGRSDLMIRDIQIPQKKFFSYYDPGIVVSLG